MDRLLAWQHHWWVMAPLTWLSNAVDHAVYLWLTQPQLMLTNDTVWVSHFQSKFWVKYTAPPVKQHLQKSIRSSSLISSYSITSVIRIKSQKARLSKFQKVKLRIMIYFVERNYAIDYIITIYYFYELEYWIKSLRSET